MTGFKTKEEMFEYLIGCKFFAKRSYVYENINLEQRRKEKKRPIYKAFVEYLKKREYPENQFIKYWNENKTEYQQNTIKKFEKEEEFKKIMVNYQNKLIIRNKFNGIKIKNLTNLQDKELGKFIE